MTDIATIHAALAVLLTTDPFFVEDIEAIGLGAAGQIVVPGMWYAFRDPRQIHTSKLPLFVLEKGDSDAQAVLNDGNTFGVMGFSQQDMATDILVGMIWHQPDHDTAYQQRLKIEPAFLDLMLRHPDVGGAVQAWVRHIQFDRGALHPTHTAVVSIRVEYTQHRVIR